VENFISKIARKVEGGANFEEFFPILEAMCQAYNPGWLLLARWHIEERTGQGYERAKAELRRFLENGPPDADAAEAWALLAHACYQTKDALGEVHAFIERAQYPEVSFNDLSNTANRLNQFLRDHGVEMDKEQRREFAIRLLAVMRGRRSEAGAGDLSRMAWLAIHCGRESTAREYVTDGLTLEPENWHLANLAQRLGLATMPSG
jgi:hypothetical protein